MVWAFPVCTDGKMPDGDYLTECDLPSHNEQNVFYIKVYYGFCSDARWVQMKYMTAFISQIVYKV